MESDIGGTLRPDFTSLDDVLSDFFSLDTKSVLFFLESLLFFSTSKMTGARLVLLAGPISVLIFLTELLPDFLSFELVGVALFFSFSTTLDLLFSDLPDVGVCPLEIFSLIRGNLSFLPALKSSSSSSGVVSGSVVSFAFDFRRMGVTLTWAFFWLGVFASAPSDLFFPDFTLTFSTSLAGVFDFRPFASTLGETTSVSFSLSVSSWARSLADFLRPRLDPGVPTGEDLALGDDIFDLAGVFLADVFFTSLATEYFCRKREGRKKNRFKYHTGW